MKHFLKYAIILLPLALVLAALQELVIHGTPLRVNENYIGEAFTTWVYLLIVVYTLKWLIQLASKQLRQSVFDTKWVITGFVIFQIICFILLLVISVIILIVISGSFQVRFKPSDQTRFIFLYFFLVNALVFMLIMGVRLYKLYHQEKDAKHLAEKSFMEAQLQMLRQQLNPHFLFNNLNIIVSTIKTNPTLAQAFTKSMASFYRKVLETENAGWVTLRTELKTIQSYLYMLSIRFEDKLLYNITIDEACLDRCLLPDFILQPIIENVIKHNTSSKAKPLHIDIYLQDGFLIVRNNLQPTAEQQDSLGVGWFNIESRYKYLEATMPEKFVADGYFFVKIALRKNDIA
jgi:sensor histidine kinase YesM